MDQWALSVLVSVALVTARGDYFARMYILEGLLRKLQAIAVPATSRIAGM